MSSTIVAVQKEVTAKVIEALQKGNITDWVKPWVDSGESPIPYNYSTKDNYKGINILLLWLTAHYEGFSRNAWLTFKQAKLLGGSVKKDEKSVRCFHYHLAQKEAETVGGDPETFPVLRYFNLFNVDQIEGLDITTPSMQFKSDDVIADLVSVAKAYSNATGLAFAQRGDKACYLPGVDRLDMPLGEFNSMDNYAATLAHELVHSTGHSKRLDRFTKNSEIFSDGKQAYAFEELVAELGSAFMCALYGFTGTHLQHESYIASWLDDLAHDHSYIFRASTAASKAMDFILSNANQRLEENAV